MVEQDIEIQNDIHPKKDSTKTLQEQADRSSFIISIGNKAHWRSVDEVSKDIKMALIDWLID